MEGIAVDGIYYAKAAAFLGAAIAVGVGSIGPALGQGFIGMKACENIGKYPKSSGEIKTTMFLAMGITETALIYVGLASAALVYAGFSIS